MSERPSLSLNENFVQDYYVQILTERQVKIVLAAWEPFREQIEYLLGDFDPENQSWRDYRNAAFPNIGLPDPLERLAKIQTPCCVAAKTLLRWGYYGDDPEPLQPRWIMVDCPPRFFSYCPYCGAPRLEADFLEANEDPARPLIEGQRLLLEGLEATVKLQARSLAKMQERIDERPRVDALIKKKDDMIQALSTGNEKLHTECKRLEGILKAAQTLVNQGAKP